MSDSELPNITVPEHLLTFRQALRPCLDKTERTLHKLSRPTFASVDGMPDPGEILQRAGMSCGNLDDLVQLMMIEVIADPDVSAATTYRHVGRFERNLDILLNACEQASYVDVYGNQEAKRLLVAGLSNLLEQIRDWLKDICDTLDDPLRAYQSRPHDLEDNSAVFSFDLVLKAPAEFQHLNQLAENAAQSTKPGNNFWRSVSSLLLGFALADWLLGDD